MPWYEWTRSEPFRDTRNGRAVAEGDVVELPANVADPAHGFVPAETPEAGDDDADGDGDADDAGDAAAAATEYTREELEAMDWQDLRGLAAEADTDAIDGKSERAEIVAYLTGTESSD